MRKKSEYVLQENDFVVDNRRNSNDASNKRRTIGFSQDDFLANGVSRAKPMRRRRESATLTDSNNRLGLNEKQMLSYLRPGNEGFSTPTGNSNSPSKKLWIPDYIFALPGSPKGFRESLTPRLKPSSKTPAEVLIDLR